MSRRISISLRLFLLLAMVVSVGFVSTGVRAEGEGPEVKVIATGLDNPRGITIGPDGALYVAESGRGGDNCIDITIGGEAGTACLGLTGAVTRIARGQQVRILKNLPSVSGTVEGDAATGPTDVAFTLQGLRVLMGLGANPDDRSQLPAEYQMLGKMFQFVPGRSAKAFIDVAGYEASNNPEPTAVDSNPYSLVNRGSKAVVVDAGGNSLLEVHKDGKIKTLAIFPPRLVNTPPGIPFPLPPQMMMEAVPNSVVIGPDGAYYVGQLGGFPFPPGESNVYKVLPGHEPELYQSGFTAIIDLAFDKAGNLYVLEIAANGLAAAEFGGDFTGALIKVAKDGTRTTIMKEGLLAPSGMAVAKNGTIYVANKGVMPGLGEVLQIRP